MTTVRIADYIHYVTCNKNFLSVPDHLGGFNKKYFSPTLEKVVQIAKQHNIDNIVTGYVLDNRVKSQYTTIIFVFSHNLIGIP